MLRRNGEEVECGGRQRADDLPIIPDPNIKRASKIRSSDASFSQCGSLRTSILLQEN